MKNILAVARLTLKEGLGQKILYSVLIMALAVIFFAVLLSGFFILAYFLVKNNPRADADVKRINSPAHRNRYLFIAPVQYLVREALFLRSQHKGGRSRKIFLVIGGSSRLEAKCFDAVSLEFFQSFKNIYFDERNPGYGAHRKMEGFLVKKPILIPLKN